MRGHTAGPWDTKAFHGAAEFVALQRTHGMEPTQAVTNDGARIVMAGSESDRVRVAVVDSQTEFKRGQGHRVECAERDANARLIAAAPDLYALALRVAEHFADTDAPLGEEARALIAKAQP